MSDKYDDSKFIDEDDDDTIGRSVVVNRAEFDRALLKLISADRTFRAVMRAHDAGATPWWVFHDDGIQGMLEDAAIAVTESANELRRIVGLD